MNDDRLATRALIAGGVAWSAAAVIGLHAHDLRFNLAEATWIVSDVAILCGLSRLPSRPFGTVARRGLALALLARLVFIAAEVMSVIQQRDSNVLLPIAAVLTAIGMTTYGVAVARRSGPSVRRFTALAVGIYPILLMFPFVAVTGQPNLAAIAIWGIVIAALGAALPAPVPALSGEGAAAVIS